MAYKSDTLNQYGFQGGKGELLAVLDSRYHGVVAPATERVRSALLGAGFADVVIEADMPQPAQGAPVIREGVSAANILKEAVEFVPAPYLDATQETPVAQAQAVMQQTVRSPEYS